MLNIIASLREARRDHDMPLLKEQLSVTAALVRDAESAPIHLLQRYGCSVGVNTQGSESVHGSWSAS